MAGIDIPKASSAELVDIERARCAEIADGLAEKWEASAAETRRKGTRPFFFGLGKPYVTSAAEGDAKTIDAAAHGVRAIAKLIRDGATRR